MYLKLDGFTQHNLMNPKFKIIIEFSLSSAINVTAHHIYKTTCKNIQYE